MTQLLAAAVGVLAGLHTATWGMYKDAPHEGFTIPKYLRSPVVAILIALVGFVSTIAMAKFLMRGEIIE